MGLFVSWELSTEVLWNRLSRCKRGERLCHIGHDQPRCMGEARGRGSKVAVFETAGLGFRSRADWVETQKLSQALARSMNTRKMQAPRPDLTLPNQGGGES